MKANIVSSTPRRSMSFFPGKTDSIKNQARRTRRFGR